MAENCTEHTIQINNLKKDMESVRNHEKKFNATIERVEDSIDRINESIFKLNTNIEHFKDIPDRLRKLEDKSILNESIKNLGWVLLIIVLTAYAGQYFVATKEEKNYENVKDRG